MDDIKVLAKRALEPAKPDMRMSAYYYSFVPTGMAEIDIILSAVASAGKSYHSTEHWDEREEGNEFTLVDQIQTVASVAADNYKAIATAYLALAEKVERLEDAMQISQRELDSIASVYREINEWHSRNAAVKERPRISQDKPKGGE